MIPRDREDTSSSISPYRFWRHYTQYTHRIYIIIIFSVPCTETFPDTPSWSPAWSPAPPWCPSPLHYPPGNPRPPREYRWDRRQSDIASLLTCFFPSFFLSFGLFFLKNLQKHQEQRTAMEKTKTVIRAMTCHLLSPVLLTTVSKSGIPPLSVTNKYLYSL